MGKRSTTSAEPLYSAGTATKAVDPTTNAGARQAQEGGQE